MTIVFVETDAAGQVTLTSAEAITFARKNPQLLPDGGVATSREISGPILLCLSSRRGNCF